MARVTGAAPRDGPGGPAAAADASEMPLVVDEASVAHWRYLGEGEANLLLRWTGPASSPFDGHVLRLRKLRFSAAASAGGDAAPSNGLLEQHPELRWFRTAGLSETAAAQFAAEQLGPWLGSRYVRPARLALLSAGAAGELARRLEPLRPAARRRAGHLRPARQLALLLPDLTRLPEPQTAPALGLELKPKWALSPPPGRACRFCLQQTLKLRAGAVHAASHFCPLDLFSACAPRVARALQALVEQPQNNLKVFLAGQLVYTGSLGGREAATAAADGGLAALAQAMDQALGTGSCARAGGAPALLTQLMAALLEREPDLLAGVQALQLRDRLGVPGAAALAQALARLPSAVSDVQPLPWPADLERPAPLPAALSVGEAVGLLRDFLVSTTAKDCSVYLTVARGEAATGEGRLQLELGEVVLGLRYWASAIDLDAKPLAHLDRWLRLHEAIEAAHPPPPAPQQRPACLPAHACAQPPGCLSPLCRSLRAHAPPPSQPRAHGHRHAHGNGH